MFHRTHPAAAALCLLTLAACGGGGGTGTDGGSGGAGDGGGDPFAPSGLHYEVMAAAYIVEVPIRPNTPMWDGVITEFVVEPPLPAGLVLDPATGVISGTPLVTIGRADWTITGRSDHGEVDAQLELRVSEAPALLMGGFADGTLGSFSVDPLEGSLTPLGLDYAPQEAGSLRDIVFHPGGEFAYSANHSPLGSDRDISVFRVDPDTGIPTYVESEPFLEGAHSIAVAPAGDLAFVTSRANHRIQAFWIDQETGSLSPAAPAIPTGTSPDRVVADPQGRFVVVQNFNSLEMRIYTVDSELGALTPAGGLVFTSPPRRPTDLALSEDGDMLYVTFEETSEIQQFPIEWDPITEEPILTWGKRTQTGSLPTSIAVGPRGTHLLVACQGSQELRSYALDIETGDLALAAIEALPEGPRQVVLDESGSYAYVSFEGLHEVLALQVSSLDHSLEVTGSIRTRPGLEHLAIATAVSARSAVALNVYTVNMGSESLSAFSVDPNSDLLTSTGQDTFLGLRPSFTAIGPRGDALWIADATQDLLAGVPLGADGAIEGAPTVQVELPAEPRGITTDASGRFVFVTVDAPGQLLCFRANLSTQSLEHLQTLDISGGPRSVTCDPTGRFVHVSCLDRIDTFLFDGQQLGWEPAQIFAPGEPGPIRFSNDGRTAYVCLAASHLIAPCVVHPTSGTLTFVAGGTLPTAQGMRPMAFLPSRDGASAVALLQQPATATSTLLRVDLGEDGRDLTELASSVLPSWTSAIEVGPRAQRLYTLDPGADLLGVHDLPDDLPLGDTVQVLQTGVEPARVLLRRGLQ